MTPEELDRAKIELAIKSAWIEGFRAARHWPNHALPELHLKWDGSKVLVTPTWGAGKPGYLG